MSVIAIALLGRLDVLVEADQVSRVVGILECDEPLVIDAVGPRDAIRGLLDREVQIDATIEVWRHRLEEHRVHAIWSSFSAGSSQMLLISRLNVAFRSLYAVSVSPTRAIAPPS